MSCGKTRPESGWPIRATGRGRVSAGRRGREYRIRDFTYSGRKNGRTFAEPGRGEADGREGVLTEAFGRITPENVGECAETVEIVSKVCLSCASNWPAVSMLVRTSSAIYR